MLQEVRVGSSVLDDADDIKQGLREAYRALKVVNMVNGQNLIAIAGPQGAGKTSTVKWICDLPDGYLPIGTVTGEKLLVLIIEQDKDSIDPFAHRYHPDSGKMTIEEISKEKCRETAGSPDLNDIAVEIRVPSRFFEAEGRGFLLLPGVQRKSDMHVRLARHVLPSATTALICIDDAQLAKGSVDEEFTSVRDGMEVEETHLIYALTKPRGGEKTKEAAQTLRDRFSADEDQVVVVGPPHADGEEDSSSLEWTDRLRHAVDQYVAVPHEERREQLDTLRELLDNLEGTMETPRENLRQAQARASRTEREQAQSLLKEFDKKVRLQREILDTHLETALNGYVGNAIEEVRDRIQRDDEVEGENASPALGLWTFRSMRKASLRKSTS